jgi:hypothetical protein
MIYQKGRNLGQSRPNGQIYDDEVLLGYRQGRNNEGNPLKDAAAESKRD